MGILRILSIIYWYTQALYVHPNSQDSRKRRPASKKTARWCERRAPHRAYLDGHRHLRRLVTGHVFMAILDVHYISLDCQYVQV